MAERRRNKIWAWRVTFAAFALCVILFRLLPLGSYATQLPGPDFILVTGFVFLLRQPNSMPLWLLVTFLLLADFLLQRPPGLWTLLAVIGAEYLRSSRSGIVDTAFLIEWLVVSAVILSMVILQRIILWILIADQPSLGLSLMEGLATLAIYPIVVLISKYILRMDKLPPVEMELPQR